MERKGRFAGRVALLTGAVISIMVSINGGLTACVGERKEAQPEATDTLTVATPDSVPSDSVQPVTPKHVDGLFDDFAFLFMSNSKFQQRRVRFPLPVVEDGKTH